MHVGRQPPLFVRVCPTRSGTSIALQKGVPNELRIHIESGSAGGKLVMKVLVADDHAVVREGLKRILTQDQGIDVVAEAEDGAAALARVREMDLDVVVL